MSSIEEIQSTIVADAQAGKLDFLSVEAMTEPRTGVWGWWRLHLGMDWHTCWVRTLDPV